jgi:hypothetical protein
MRATHQKKLEALQGHGWLLKAQGHVEGEHRGTFRVQLAHQVSGLKLVVLKGLPAHELQRQLWELERWFAWRQHITHGAVQGG